VGTTWASRRWLLWVIAAIGDVVVMVRFGVAVHNAAAGVASGILLAGLVALLVVAARRHVERQLASAQTGPLEVPGFLDLACLPGKWPVLAREALGSVGGPNSYGMNVLLAVSDGYLTIARRQVATTGKRAFTARVPLRSIAGIVVGKSRMTLGGSSMTFDIASGEELRLDVTASLDSTERVSGLFREAVRTAPSDSASPLSGIEVTSLPPPVRTSPATAGLSMLAFIPPWILAIIGIRNGPFAGVTVTVGLFLSVALMLIRPRWLTTVLVRMMCLSAAAFALDTIRTGQPIRLGGTACCLLIAALMAGPRPDRRRAS
jgi:hypothetical protein